MRRSGRAPAGSPPRSPGAASEPGDTVAVMLPNTPPMLEAHFGVPMAGAVLNSINIRLEPATIAYILEHGAARVLLADCRVRADHQGGADPPRAPAARGRRARPAVPRRGRAPRRGDLRGAACGRRGELRAALPGRRMAGDRPELHLGHHGPAQGRRGPSPRRLARRDRPGARQRDGPASDLSLDLAHVPLQRLGVHLERDAAGGHARVPAPGRGGARLRGDRRARGDSPVRRADRDEHDRQCAGRGAHPVRPSGAGDDRRRGAARGRPAEARGAGHRRDPPLRPDRVLRPGHGLRLAGGTGMRSRPTTRRGCRRARACATRRSRRWR